MTGAEIFVESLKKENVEVIFGYPGGSSLPIFDKLYGADLRLILPRHEQGGVHAAEGYARVTGKPGVCLTTSGPGATNTVTGIANAYMDSVPLVVFTGQVKTFLIGNDAFQEADITGITRPITKHNYLVKDVKDLACTIKEAFHIAATGRPGPVVVDIPVDVQLQDIAFEYPATCEIRSYKPTTKGHPGQIKKAAKAIAKAKKPIIYAGGGIIISGAHEELRMLAEKIKAPVTMTLMGLGGFDGCHELSLGMLGMHGTVYANHAIMDSDLIIAVGARFDDRVTGKLDSFAPHAHIIHIDIDPSSISKNVKVHVPIVGDAKEVLQELIGEIKKPPETEAWLATIREWKEKYPLRYKDEGEIIKPQYVIQKIDEITKGEAIICTEVGQNQMWTAQYFNFTKPRTLVTSGGLGTMGFGFPASIGAKLGRPDAIVFDVAGDGSIQMNSQELMTAVAEKIPVKIAILNNGFLGMVRQWQELFYGRRYSGTVMKDPDFVKLAEAYGAVGMRVQKKSDVENAIKKAIEIDNVVMLDFIVAPEENVFPMVPAGEAINRMIGGMA